MLLVLETLLSGVVTYSIGYWFGRRSKLAQRPRPVVSYREAIEAVQRMEKEVKQC